MLSEISFWVLEVLYIFHVTGSPFLNFLVRLSENPGCFAGKAAMAGFKVYAIEPDPHIQHCGANGPGSVVLDC
jgi:hypothetical protein